MSKNLIAGLLICVCGTMLGLGGMWYAATRPKPQAVPVVPAGNKVPDRYWLQDYQTLMDLQDEINRIQIRDGLAIKNDQFRGLASRLNAQIPNGYEFDEATRSFRPKQLTPMPAPPPPAAQTPSPPAAPVTPAPSTKPIRGVKPPPHAELSKKP